MSLKSRSFRFLSVAFVFIFSLSGFGQVKEPVEPQSPGVEFNSFSDKDKKATAGRCSIRFAGGQVLTGTADFAASYIEYKTDEKKSNIRKLDVTELKRIEFLQWKPVPKGADTFLFSPSMILIHKTDGMNESSQGISNINSVVLKSRGRIIRCHFCFYEYRRKGRWINSGKRDFAYPETKPLKDTVISIDFIRTNQADLIRTLLRGVSDL